jgi:hypothetical protein
MQLISDFQKGVGYIRLFQIDITEERKGEGCCGSVIRELKRVGADYRDCAF